MNSKRSGRGKGTSAIHTSLEKASARTSGHTMSSSNSARISTYLRIRCKSSCQQTHAPYRQVFHVLGHFSLHLPNMLHSPCASANPSFSSPPSFPSCLQTHPLTPTRQCRRVKPHGRCFPLPALCRPHGFGPAAHPGPERTHRAASALSWSATRTKTAANTTATGPSVVGCAVGVERRTGKA